MRITKRRRWSAVALAATVALTLSGCLAGGDDEEGDSDNEVLVWAQHGPARHRRPAGGPGRACRGEDFTVTIEAVEDINSLIMQRIQAGDVPDIAMIPQPGVVADVVDRADTVALDDVLDMAALEESMTPGTLEAGTVDDELRGLLVSMNVKSLVFYNKPAWEKAGYPTPADHRRAQRAHRADQGRRQHAVVHGDRGRRRHRMGRHRLDGGPDHALRRRRRVQRVGRPRDAVRLRRGPRGGGGVRGAAVHRGQLAGRPRGDRQHQLRQRRQPDVQGGARLLDVQAGLVHDRLLPGERGRRGPRQGGRRVRLPAGRGGRGEPGPRWRRHGRDDDATTTPRRR